LGGQQDDDPNEQPKQNVSLGDLHETAPFAFLVFFANVLMYR